MTKEEIVQRMARALWLISGIDPKHDEEYPALTEASNALHDALRAMFPGTCWSDLVGEDFRRDF